MILLKYTPIWDGYRRGEGVLIGEVRTGRIPDRMDRADT
jgi:hypothetical protein